MHGKGILHRDIKRKSHTSSVCGFMYSFGSIYTFATLYATYVYTFATLPIIPAHP
jgi:hypothetical protein